MSEGKPLAELFKSEQMHQKIMWSEGAAKFLSFPMSHETTGLLSLDRLVEVIKVCPKNILPIPQMPDYLLGIVNRQGGAVWLVDLLYLMGASHLYQRKPIPEDCLAILVQAEEQAIGLLVEKISSIEVYNPTNLQPFSDQTLPSRLLSFFEGYFVDAKGQTLALLNVDTIIKKVENPGQEIY